MIKLADVTKEFEKYAVIKDKNILRMIFGTILGNMVITRDPIWLMIVAPSSGGKTMLVSPCDGIPHIYFLDDLTEKSLLSGFKGKKETSLLKIIGSGLMIFSDFTSILSKNKDSRGEILTQLRLVFDRKVTKYTGLGGTGWEGKIGAIACSTPEIYAYMESGKALGERFTYYWMEQPTNEEISRKQDTVSISSKEVTETMKEYYANYIADVNVWVNENGVPELKMTPEQQRKVEAASIFCVQGKASIHTNYKSGKPDGIPNIAGIGRDSKIFTTLLHTLQLMEAYETDDIKAAVTDEMIDIIEKCAYSSINRERRKILEILVENDSPMTGSQIGAKAGLGLEKEAVEMHLHPLHAVGVIVKKPGNPFKWAVEDEWTRAFVKRVMGATHDLTEVSGIELPEEDVDPLEEEYNNL